MPAGSRGASPPSAVPAATAPPPPGVGTTADGEASASALGELAAKQLELMLGLLKVYTSEWSVGGNDGAYDRNKIAAQAS